LSNTKVIIGTRGSKLALWQANYTQQILSKHNIEAEIKIIQTKGDASQTWNTSFDKLEGKGFFTKELEEALLNNDIDLAVHSCKDLPTVFPDGLTISAYSKRANPFDVLLINKEKVDVTLPLKLKTDAIVGTSSSRRKAQLLSYRKDITIKDIRGNVPTRISKLENGEFDAILLAQAGIDRLEIDISKFEIVPLEAPMFIPAAAQGILAYQIRENDERMRQLTTCLHDENDAEISTLERKILNAFDGGCQVPLAIYVKKEADWNHVWISLAQSWNGMPFRTHTQYKNLKDVDVSALVQQIRNPKPKKVFITSNLSVDSFFKTNLEAHTYQVDGISFLDFKAVDFDKSLINNADWVFLSSKHAIDFFVPQYYKKDLEHTKFAVLGKGTEMQLNKYGIQADFVGDGHGDTSARLFEQKINGKVKVLFPGATQSLHQVQNNFSKGLTDITNLSVYQNTMKSDICKIDADIIVCTSPMNAKAYFSKFEKESKQTVISIGRSTSSLLSEMNIEHKVAYLPYDYCLVDEVLSVE